MKKKIAVLLVTVLLIGGLFPINVLGIALDPEAEITSANGSHKSCKTLKIAFDTAVDGDLISLCGDEPQRQTSVGLTVTKNVTFKTGYSGFAGSQRYVRYGGTSAPLFTIENGGTLTVTDSDIFGNSDFTILAGGFAYVKKGGTLILDGKSGSPVNIKGFGLKAQNSTGGAVYCEQGGKVIINGVTFSNNLAAKGNDLYAEQISDATVAPGVTANAAYGESVIVKGINLLLNGEIGLMFHTLVPEKYTGGSFALSCRTGDDVTYKISECEKDEFGYYIVKYNLKPIELSEAVTLNILDKDGDTVTSDTKSVTEYADLILEKKSATEKELKVIKTLLNYGHFSQIECAKSCGWKIGEDYAEISKYGELCTDNTEFDDCLIKYSGTKPQDTKLGVQLILGYKTNINLYFKTSKKPLVTVNGKAVWVEDCSRQDFNYRIAINKISALDLDKTFDIQIDGGYTITLSPLCYCKLAVYGGDQNTADAVKALYEFFKATVALNGNI